MLYFSSYTETDELSNCRAHMETLRRDSNMEEMMDALLDTQHSQQFCAWYRDYVRHMSNKKFEKCSNYLFVIPTPYTELFNLDSMFIFIMLAGRSFGRSTEDGNGGQISHAF